MLVGSVNLLSDGEPLGSYFEAAAKGRASAPLATSLVSRDPSEAATSPPHFEAPPSPFPGG